MLIIKTTDIGGGRGYRNNGIAPSQINKFLGPLHWYVEVKFEFLTLPTKYIYIYSFSRNSREFKKLVALQELSSRGGILLYLYPLPGLVEGRNNEGWSFSLNGEGRERRIWVHSILVQGSPFAEESNEPTRLRIEESIEGRFRSLLRSMKSLSPETYFT